MSYSEVFFEEAMDTKCINVQVVNSYPTSKFRMALLLCCYLVCGTIRHSGKTGGLLACTYIHSLVLEHITEAQKHRYHLQSQVMFLLQYPFCNFKDHVF